MERFRCDDRPMSAGQLVDDGLCSTPEASQYDAGGAAAAKSRIGGGNKQFGEERILEAVDRQLRRETWRWERKMPPAYPGPLLSIFGVTFRWNIAADALRV